MMGYSRGTIAGNVGRDAELTYTQDGLAVCRFSVAVNRRRGEEERVNWWNVVLFGRTAENADQLVRKGAPVLVDGEMSLNQWTGNDGQERQSLEIVGGTFILLSGANRSEEEQPDSEDAEDVDLSDVPFD